MSRKLFLRPAWMVKVANRLSVVFMALGVFSNAHPRAVAQSITTDGTLGTPQTLTGPNYTIPQASGQTAGSNLFHSFGRFNINAGEAATFESSPAIRNIFSRVTGGESSLINGLLATQGQNVNLFFLNPNGILFGPNAQLNVTGSFLATTADRITFADGTQFSATATQPSPALTVSVPLGLQFGNRPGLIVVQGDGRVVNGFPTPVLATGVNQTLALIGGDVTLQGGTLGTVGGQVEVGSVGDGSFVGLSTIEPNWKFDYSGVSNFRDIQLNGQSAIVAQNAGASGIRLQTGSLTLRDGAVIQSVASEQGRAGNIVVNAKDRVNLVGGNQSPSLISSNKSATADPVGGDVQVNARSLSLTNGAAIITNALTSTSGNITISSFDTASIEGEGAIGSSQISTAASGGNAGNINIQTGTLQIKAGGQVISGVLGNQEGAAGNITINSRDAVLVDGTGKTTRTIETGQNSILPSSISSRSAFNLSRPSGETQIKTGSLSVTNGATITSSSLGQSNKGNIVIQARDHVTVSGSSALQVEFRPGVFVSSLSSISSANLNSEDGGNAGNIEITARDVNISEGGQIISDMAGKGKAGDIVIDARDSVVVDGESRQTFTQSVGTASTISSLLSPIATRGAQGGNITIKTGRLQVSQGGEVTVDTFGQGNAGNISISARDQVVLTGVGRDFASEISSGVGPLAQGMGNGGTISIDTGSLLVEKGASLSTSTTGNGNAGKVIVNARDTITVDGESQISSIVGRSLTSQERSQFEQSNRNLRQPSAQLVDEPTGNGGEIQLNARSLAITNGAIISAQSRGRGDAGNIKIQVRDQLIAKNGAINNLSEKTSGGQLAIQAGSIRLSGDSDISTRVGQGNGSGGDITLTANSITALNDSDILAFAQDGKGGNITLNTRAFFGQNYRPAVAGTQPETLDNNGRVDVNASGAVSGTVTLPDTSFIQNELTSLPDTPIDTETLLANSCIRRDRKTGTFYITGSGSLPTRPGETPYSSYETAEVRSTGTPQTWKSGDAIVEPQGVYALANGQRVMSRLCVE